jgi:hypothetical protein
MTLPVAALEVLAAGLAALSRSSFRAHARPVDRLAVSYRVCSRATDALSDAHVEFGAFISRTRQEKSRKLPNLGLRWRHDPE